MIFPPRMAYSPSNPFRIDLMTAPTAFMPSLARVRQLHCSLKNLQMPNKHTARIAHLEQVYPQHRNGNRGAEIRLELDRLYREIADEEAAERHKEAIREAQASRRLDKWAFWVAGGSLVLSAISTGIAVVALRQPPSTPLPATGSQVLPSSAPADRADPTPGSASKISTPATKPTLPPSAPLPDKKPKALPPQPKE